MPSTQYGADYLVGELPVFIGNVQMQDAVGNCRVLSLGDISRITFTHTFRSGAFPLPTGEPVGNLVDISVPIITYLGQTITGSAADPAFQYSGRQPFDYNFIYTPTLDQVFFPEVGSYLTTFSVEVTDGMIAVLEFRTTARRLNVTVEIPRPFRILGRLYTKVKNADGTVAVRWARPSDYEFIECTLYNSFGTAIQTKYFLPVDHVSATLLDNPCMFMDGSNPFLYNFQLLWEDFTHITERRNEYKLTTKLHHASSDSAESWDMTLHHSLFT